MGSTSMYWISTLSYFFILSFIMIKDYKITKKPGREEKSYRTMLSWVIYFCLQDTLWGLCDNDIIDNDSIFFIATMIFFISTVITTYFWLNFVLVYMKEKRRKLLLALDVLLIIADIIILTVNIFIPIVFRIENGIYVTKALRPFLFLNQYIAYVFICILSLIYWLKEESDNRSRYLSVFIFTCAVRSFASIPTLIVFCAFSGQVINIYYIWGVLMIFTCISYFITKEKNTTEIV